MDRWWKLQERGDEHPFGVAFVGQDGLIRRYVPGEGLVDWPPLAMWIVGDEFGATEIGRAEADVLIAAEVGKLSGRVDTASCRGSAATIPVPG